MKRPFFSMSYNKSSNNLADLCVPNFVEKHLELKSRILSKNNTNDGSSSHGFSDQFILYINQNGN